MSNWESTIVKISTILQREPFIEGAFDVVLGVTMYENPRYETASQWWQQHYERGRLFGLLCQEPIRKGRTINKAAIAEYARLRKDGLIV